MVITGHNPLRHHSRHARPAHGVRFCRCLAWPRSPEPACCCTCLPAAAGSASCAPGDRAALRPGLASVRGQDLDDPGGPARPHRHPGAAPLPPPAPPPPPPPTPPPPPSSPPPPPPPPAHPP